MNEFIREPKLIWKDERKKNKNGAKKKKNKENEMNKYEDVSKARQTYVHKWKKEIDERKVELKIAAN